VFCLVKARLIVKGNVQGVGYRALVKLFARRLGVKGLVRNLEDGSVEVFVDGSKQAIEELSKRISVEGRAKDPLSLHVDGLDVYWEGVKGYQPAWRGYVGFEIDYGVDELRSTEREMLESLEWSKLHFTGMSTVFREEIGGVKGELVGLRDEFREEFGGLKGEFKYMRADMKEMHEDLRDGIVGVRSEVKDMHVDMNKSFEEMAKRYDAISSELVRTREELTRAVSGLLKLIEEFIQERHRVDRAEHEE